MYLVISDLHQGLTRKTGVTAASLEQLENDKIKSLSDLMHQHEDKEVIIAGDLFDSYNVPLRSLIQVSSVLLQHPKKVWIIAGNHDLSKNTLKMSSLQFFSEWSAMNSSNLEFVFEPQAIDENITVIPHMPNQELFDEAVGQASANILITHCNYENNFAVEKDHSLNLTKKQAAKFKMVISGHEHNARTIGNVHMIGSFAPCNVQEATVDKVSHVLNSKTLTLESVKAFDFSWEELHWTELDISLNDGFLKVVGEATASEAPTVLSAVAALRKKSKCYMIQNAVTVESVDLGEVEGASFESLDTMEILAGILDEKYKNRLEELGYVID